MELSEAYARLGLTPVLEFEARRNRLDPERHMGTTTHTLVQMYLDAASAFSSVGYSKVHKIRFLCLSLEGQARILRDMLKDMHESLDLDVPLSQIDIYPPNISKNILDASLYYTWGIFCDHAIKERTGNPRTSGPFGLVRSIDYVGPDCYFARDRGRKGIGHLTEEGAHRLIDNATVPIEFQASKSRPIVSFGAWTRNGLRYRLKAPFNL